MHERLSKMKTLLGFACPTEDGIPKKRKISFLGLPTCTVQGGLFWPRKKQKVVVSSAAH